MDIQSDVCADCTASSPQWASVNRGVLLCDECSSIHRQLGRHISQIKHLKKSRWRPGQLDMVRYLAAAGANRYWEHVLYEPMLTGQHANTSRGGSDKQQLQTRTKKPNPHDPVHPTKAEFIREKYLFLGFFKRPRNVNQDDLNHQLHASVRTGVLETSLYLLALGADPNFVHPVKGNSPIHVACQYGQLGQVEVLLAYGADVCVRDGGGRTPVDIALERSLAAVEASGSLPAGPLTYEQKLSLAWSPLVDTLVNAYYEVTDSLAYFLARRAPDHKEALLGSKSILSPALPKRKDSLRSDSRPTGSTQSHTSSANGHFLVSTPLLHTMNGNCNGLAAEDWIFEARRRLNHLPSMAFEDLCVDVYDEADRRLTNSFLENPDGHLSLDSSVNGLHDLHKPSSSPPEQNSVAVVNRSLTLYFLPPNTAYSSVRNQARQKLGRLSTVEFHTLVLDILTEVSARLLPLFPPTSTNRPTRLNDSSKKHSYQPCITPSSLPEEIPTSVATRSVPLPSPPLREPGLLGELNVSSPVESTTPPTNAPFILKETAETNNFQTSNDKPQRNGTRCRTRSDDPVYDQVATDSDVQASLTPTSPTLPHSPSLSSNSILNGVAPFSPNGVPLEASLNADSKESLNKYDKSVVTSGFDNTALSVPTQMGASITSQPGPSPGSRRLHLSHTSRAAQLRASVPSAHMPMTKSMENSLSPVLEAVNLATNVSATHNSSNQHCKRPTDSPTVTTSTAATTPRAGSPQKSTLESCCVAARNEVDRLRKENIDLRSQLCELQISKKLVEDRMKTLEEQVSKMGVAMESLQEEKSTLLAAFSAGMVRTHSPPKQKKICFDTNIEGDSDSDRQTKPVQSTDHVEPTFEEYEEEAEDYCDQNSDAGNYSVGSHSLDSGVLLRQGIIMRSSNRGDSPASSVLSTEPVSTSSLVTSYEPPLSVQSGDFNQHKPTDVCSATPVSNSSSYVNMRPVAPKLMPKPLVGAVRVFPKPFVPPSTSIISHSNKSGDYVAPNSTGSASPAPQLPASDHSLQLHTTHTSSVPSVNSRIIHQRQQELQKQHAQILASIATLPDYDSPVAAPNPVTSAITITPLSQPEPMVKKQTTESNEYASWQGPTSDRVVRCVEVIIVRIRNLVQLANGERTGDFVTCSLLIQSAVQDILGLFPPINQCPQRVASALSDLSSVSRELRPHCESMSQKLGATPQRQTNPVPPTLAPEINVLIRHAHQIAKAAKELLSIFQRNN